MYKVCIVTSTRADYGILQNLMKQISSSGHMELQILACGSHLSPDFGLTYREMEQDGYSISYRIEHLLSGDSDTAILKSAALATLGFADAWDTLKPDLVVVLGDRYEILYAAASAMLHRIPLAHIHGGEITEGAYDNAIRHAVTKMSQLHFCSTPEYRDRVIQMGEAPDSVWYSGAMGIENIHDRKLLTQTELEADLGLDLNKPFFLVTFHPETLSSLSPEQQSEQLFQALRRFSDYRVVFTKANADAGGRMINQAIDAYAARYPEQAAAFFSLGYVRYLSLMRFSTAVIGNSSSGIIEAPSLAVPTVDIGDRQKGRVSAPSVLHCACSEEDIVQTIKKAVSPDFRGSLNSADNPYYKSGSSSIIAEKILAALQKGIALQKTFYDIKGLNDEA